MWTLTIGPWTPSKILPLLLKEKYYRPGVAAGHAHRSTGSRRCAGRAK
jgi:hypothetical protein